MVGGFRWILSSERVREVDSEVIPGWLDFQDPVRADGISGRSGFRDVVRCGPGIAVDPAVREGIGG